MTTKTATDESRRVHQEATRRGLVPVWLTAHGCGAYAVEDGSGREAWFGTDWDHAPLASSLLRIEAAPDGDCSVASLWSPPSGCTDGTVDCPETGATVAQMLAAAGEALDAAEGETLWVDPWVFDTWAGDAE